MSPAHLSTTAVLLAACGGLTAIPSADDYLDDDSGIGVALVGDLAINPESVDFGYVETGLTQDEVLKLTNTGDYLITMADFSIVGEGVFEVTALSLGDQSYEADDEITLSNGETLELVVTFAPVEVKESFTGAVSFVSDISGNEYVEVPLIGTSLDSDTTDTGTDTTVTGTLSVAPPAVDFGEVDIGHASDPYPVTITNDTSVNVAVTNFEFSDTIWSWGNDFNLPWIMEPGEAVDATLLYTPTAEQEDHGVATVVTDDAGIYGTVNLVGTGADLCDICSPVLYVSVGYAITDFFSLFGFPDQRNVVLQNTGDEPLDITAVYVKNDAIGGDFSVSGWSKAGVTLMPYESFSIDVSYVSLEIAFDLPDPAGDKNILHILSNDPIQPDWTVELTGIGIAG